MGGYWEGCGKFQVSEWEDGLVRWSSQSANQDFILAENGPASWGTT
jgi:hypothetical protein